MLGDQIMLEYIEEQVFLLEELKAVGLLSFALFADVTDEVSCFSVDNASRILFCFVGDNNEEVIETVATLDHSVEILC